MATDEQKQERFLDGLSEEMQDKLSTTDFRDLNQKVDKAHFAEDKMNKLTAKN